MYDMYEYEALFAQWWHDFSRMKFRLELCKL